MGKAQWDKWGAFEVASTTDYKIEYEHSPRETFHKILKETFRVRSGEQEYVGEFFTVAPDGASQRQNEDRDYRFDATKSFFHVPITAEGKVAYVAYSGTLEEKSPSNRPEALKVANTLIGDERPVYELLLEASNLKVRPENEVVDGHECIVLEGSGPNGKHTVWVDPANGFLWRRATVHKAPGDLYNGQPLVANQEGEDDPKLPFPTISPTSVISEIDNVKIGSIDGHFVILSSSRKYTESYDNGMIVKSARTFSLDGVQYNPDFDAKEAFRPPVENGRPVVNWDIPSLPLVYKDRGVRPAVTEQEIRGMAATIDVAAKKNRSAASAAFPPETRDALPIGIAEQSRKIRTVIPRLSYGIGVILLLVLIVLSWSLWRTPGMNPKKVQ